MSADGSQPGWNHQRLPSKAELDADIQLSQSTLESFKEAWTFRAEISDFASKAAALDSPGAHDIALIAREIAGMSDPRIMNAVELSTLYRAESSCLLQDFLTAQGFRRDLYARLLALCILESSRALKEVLGREFQAAVSETLGPFYLELAKNIHSQVSHTFKRIKSVGGDIRNELAAHRSSNRDQRFTLLSRFIELEVALIASDLRHPLRRLYEIFVIYSADHNKRLAELGGALRAHIEKSRGGEERGG
jgi:hypothetical protein